MTHSHPTWSIGPESPAQSGAIAAMHSAAFGDEEVARLVDLLRASPGYRPELSLVATDGAEVLGHVMLTPVPVRRPDGERAAVLCLAPLGVSPAAQRRGIGRALVERALARADELGEPLVLLEGDPAYYHRFGFEPAEPHGLLRPSPTIPAPAFQVRRLARHDPRLRGRVGYPAPFWAIGGVGLPEPVEDPTDVAWLFQLARYAGWIECLAAEADLATPVPACPGWTVADVLTHLGVIHRLVPAWLRDGRRPATPMPPPDVDSRAWYAQGWRDLYAALAAVAPATPAATWSPWDTTAGFWRRRMVHEIAIHAHDVVDALRGDGPPWTVTPSVALDGIDEALRLWLGTRVGERVGGSGGVVRISAGDRMWTVGLHPAIAEVHTRPTPPDATLAGPPAAVYRWLWGRGGDDQITATGDPAVRADLRRVITLAMQ